MYSSALNRIIERRTIRKKKEEQAGFRAGRSTIDKKFGVLEKTALGTDLENTYDRVPLRFLSEQLVRTGVTLTLIAALVNLYKDNMAYVKI